MAAFQANAMRHGLLAATWTFNGVGWGHGMMRTAHVALGLARSSFWYWHVLFLRTIGLQIRVQTGQSRQALAIQFLCCTASALAVVPIHSAARTQARAIGTAQRLCRRRQNNFFPDFRRQVNFIAREWMDRLVTGHAIHFHAGRNRRRAFHIGPAHIRAEQMAGILEASVAFQIKRARYRAAKKIFAAGFRQNTRNRNGSRQLLFHAFRLKIRRAQRNMYIRPGRRYCRQRQSKPIHVNRPEALNKRPIP